MSSELQDQVSIPSSHTATMLAGGLLLAVLAAPAWADCPAINFDDRAVGTIITNQYPGVTFSVHPQSCGGAPPVNVRIANAPAGGTSSGTRVLRIDTGVGMGFSPDYVRIRFDELQQQVSFTLGAATGLAGRSYDVRYIGDAFGELNVIFPTSAAGIHSLVTVTAPAGWSGIRTIEIEAPDAANYEVIDDLRFDLDTTPPVVEITEPAFAACACGVVAIRGSVCEAESAYGGDRAEYRSVNAAAADPWQLIDDCGTLGCELCAGGLLYNWDTA